MFADRREAGLLLGRAIAARSFGDPLVLALPRGGVPVAFEVARALGAPLDVFVVRKIGVPGRAEFAAGAIVDAAHPTVLLDDDTLRLLGVSASALDPVIRQERVELLRRDQVYRGGRPAPDLAGRTVIVVDDGIATGASMRAALTALRARGPARLVVAVPVAPPESLPALRALCDDVICLEQPPDFAAVGQFYGVFTQVTDGEVLDLLERAARPRRRRAHGAGDP